MISGSSYIPTLPRLQGGGLSWVYPKRFFQVRNMLVPPSKSELFQFEANAFPRPFVIFNAGRLQGWFGFRGLALRVQGLGRGRV